MSTSNHTFRELIEKIEHRVVSIFSELEQAADVEDDNIVEDLCSILAQCRLLRKQQNVLENAPPVDPSLDVTCPGCYRTINLGKAAYQGEGSLWCPACGDVWYCPISSGDERALAS